MQTIRNVANRITMVCCWGVDGGRGDAHARRDSSKSSYPTLAIVCLLIAALGTLALVTIVWSDRNNN